MRINVYGEEVTTETTWIKKQAEGHEQPFYGVRLYLESPRVLTSDSPDDDRSAITFWIPQDDNGRPNFGVIGEALDELTISLCSAQESWLDEQD